jgi:ABC-type sugar transport system ATPase subunit
MLKSYLEEEESNRIRLRLQEISKSFPGVLALDRVSFELKVGEVHAICGENGAGKSTLMNILAGNHQPDEGNIMLNDENVVIANQMVAHNFGIGIVYQEKSLVGNLSVADNIFAGMQPINSWRLIDAKKLHNQTQQLLRKLGMNIDSHIRVDKLPAGTQQMVEIAKALARDPRILILDEPTASLSEKDTQVIFKIIRLMARQGKSIIYISHRMPEIFAVADRVTVLKDGQIQGSRQITETNIDEIIRMMVGRSLRVFDYQNVAGDKVVLGARNFSGDGFRNISFDLHRGEILGFSGLVGAGRSETCRAIFGIDKKYDGKLFFNGQLVEIQNTTEAISLGIGYLPEDRKEQGLFLEMSVAENIVSAKVNQESGVFVQQKHDHEISAGFVESLSIKTPSVKTKVINLSGGNQQKIMLAKWLLLKPQVLIVDEPTAGVDVGTKSEIYQVLNELSASGTSIILISSDLPELLGISDRLLVFCNGNVYAELARAQFSEEEIMHYASGTKNMFSEQEVV